MERPSYYSILTADVRYDPRLKNHADCKVLYSEITALSNKTGYCHATNKYFAKLYGRPVPTISKWINLLKKCGYLKIEMIREGKQIKERHIYPISTPINANVNTYSGKREGGINADVKTPINADVKENITSINTTSINKLSSRRVSENLKKNDIKINKEKAEIINYYLSNLGEDVVLYVIQQTVLANRPSFSYFSYILNRYEKSGIDTLEKAKNDTRMRKGQPVKIDGPEIPLYKLGE